MEPCCAADVASEKSAPWRGKDQIGAARTEKYRAIRGLLKDESIWQVDGDCYDCLPPDRREKFEIVATDNVSAHGYDPYAQEIIDAHRDGWVLDCGAGSRAEFLPRVIFYEVVAYPSTDVLGVAESLPFRDACMDAVICQNVLEHVRDPFRAAREIARVLKPGGRLYCVVPFLQPLHGYPHHYYNMTADGLRNLFSRTLDIDRQFMLASGLPIWSLSWFLRSWLAGLPEDAKCEFRERTVAELIADPVTQLSRAYVTALPDSKNLELASTTALLATKSSTPGLFESVLPVLPDDEDSRVTRLADHFLRSEREYRQALADERQELKLTAAELIALREASRALEEELRAARARRQEAEQALASARAEQERLHLLLGDRDHAMAEQHTELVRRERLIVELDRRFNLVRRSRWWRLRRRVFRLLGKEDGKD
jgi:SAM-dependent methyltransferase